jgi:hypothetical protein
MLESPENVSSLADGYRALFGAAIFDSRQSFEELLVRNGDWSPQAATHLLRLAQGYGSFMLRNALAISLTLGIEDGDLGF